MIDDPWDSMISGDDESVAAEIRADAATYAKRLAAGDVGGCLKIEQKYGLTGLAPQAVSEHLAEMGKPAEGGTA